MIKHLTILDSNGHVHYVCNQACTVTANKIATDSKEINCKNCLQIVARINSGVKMQKYIRGKKCKN